MTSTQSIETTCAHLMSDIGEASMRSIGGRVLDEYRALGAADRTEFLAHLVRDYGVDEDRLVAAYGDWRRDRHGDRAAAARAEVALVRAAEPTRQTLLRRINHAPGATFALTELRADVRALLPRHPELAPLENDLRHLLGSWFNRGFLRMAEVTWDSSGELLDHLIADERVLPMSGLDELRRRLQPEDRRIYAFFHPATGNRPLVFVEVALTRGVPGAIAPILEPGPALRAADADTAVLYSISSALDGLAGVSFGNLLIKQVIDEASAALPQLRTFVTLSPLPGLRGWMTAQRDAETAELCRALERGDRSPELAPRVLAAAARYIAYARDLRGRPCDPVARFHLANGAQAARLHWPADRSDRADAQSYGVMINYLYEPAELERRHEEHLRHAAIALGDDVATLL